MARGIARAPSQNAYRGTLGRTQTTTVHVTGPHGELVTAQVYTTIDAVSDPELVERLHAADPARALNIVRFDGETVRVGVPVLYHDPAAELLVLVLDPAQRHRELAERIAVYERLAADDAVVPAYVKELAVVFGASGLRVYLEGRAQDALARRERERDVAELDRRRAELAAREAAIQSTRLELEAARDELERLRAELAGRRAELERARAETSAQIERIEQERAEERAEIDRLRNDARDRVMAARAAAAAEGAAEATVIQPPPTRDDSSETRPVPRSEVEAIVAAAAPPAPPPSDGEPEPFESDIETGVVGAIAARPDSNVEFDEETTGSATIPQGSDPLTTEASDLTREAGTPDPYLERAAASSTSTIAVVHGGVRLTLVVGEHIARGLGGPIDVRVVLHRTAMYPVIALVLGPPAALRLPSPTQLAIVTLDIAAESDRQVLAALSRRFELVVDLVVRGAPVRRCKLVAPLAENVGYIGRAAEDHLRGVTTEGEPSYARAVELVCGAGYDLLGVSHAEASEFRDDKLAQLDTAQQLRRAIAMARRFARPSREDYLVCARGFPLPRWRELRRHVLEQAVAWGLWMGPELAQVAVSEGLARSRRDLIAKLDRGFEVLKRHPTAFDIDHEAAEDNAKALAEEARALGVELHKRNGVGAIASDEVSVVSGSIGGTPARGLPRREPRPVAELVALLEDRQQRVAAALELCERAEPSAAAAVIGAVHKMSRAEAVRVLGMAVKFGEAAKAPLLEGLASSKAFLRHGSALALALLRTEDGTQAVIDLLLSEPTEIWREVARAIGQVGPTALLPLASTFGRLGERGDEATAERVAWAMAHVAVRGGKAAVETMAGGQSVVAPVARRALELHASAVKDHVRIRPGADGSHPGRDVTVNRAFSRRFFEALEQGLPEVGQAGLIDLDASGPMEMLDEADLIVEEEDEAELDESDLIQS
jgi:hypothetical protein